MKRTCHLKHVEADYCINDFHKLLLLLLLLLCIVLMKETSGNVWSVDVVKYNCNHLEISN